MYEVLFTYCNKSRCLDVPCNKVLQLLKTLKFRVKSVCDNVETVRGIC